MITEPAAPISKTFRCINRKCKYKLRRTPGGYYPVKCRCDRWYVLDIDSKVIESGPLHTCEPPPPTPEEIAEREKKRSENIAALQAMSVLGNMY